VQSKNWLGGRENERGRHQEIAIRVIQEKKKRKGGGKGDRVMGTRFKSKMGKTKK